MKIKISDSYRYAICPCHIQQWCMELLKFTGAEYIPESSNVYADIGINVKENVGISVFVDLSDPWSLVNTLNVDLLVDESLKNMLEVPFVAPSVAFKNSSDKGLAWIDSFDVYTSFIANKPVQEYIVPHLKHAKYIYTPHSLPFDTFFNSGKEREYDVFFSGAMDPKWYPLRNKIQRALQNAPQIKQQYSPICGNKAKEIIQTHEVSKEEMIVQFEKQLFEFANKLRNAKCTLFDGTIFNIPVKKYIESMACGCLVFAPLPIDSEVLGYVDGENMIIINDTNYMDLLNYYLAHPVEMKRITDNAYQLYLEKYTCEKSVEIFMQKLQSK